MLIYTMDFGRSQGFSSGLDKFFKYDTVASEIGILKLNQADKMKSTQQIGGVL